MRAVAKSSRVSVKRKIRRFKKKIRLTCVLGDIDCVCECKIKGNKYYIDRVRNEYGYDIYFYRTMGNKDILTKNEARIKIDNVIIKAEIVNVIANDKDNFIRIENKLFPSSDKTDYEKIIGSLVNNNVNDSGNREITCEGLIGYLLICDIGERIAYNQFFNDYEVISHSLFSNLNVIVPGLCVNEIDINELSEYIRFLEQFKNWKWKRNSSLLIIRYEARININDRGEKFQRIMLDFSTKVEYELDYLLEKKKVDSLFQLFGEIDDIIDNSKPVKKRMHKLILQKIIKGWSREIDNLKKCSTFIRK